MFLFANLFSGELPALDGNKMLVNNYSCVVFLVQMSPGGRDVGATHASPYWYLGERINDLGQKNSTLETVHLNIDICSIIFRSSPVLRATVLCLWVFAFKTKFKERNKFTWNCCEDSGKLDWYIPIYTLQIIICYLFQYICILLC